MPEELRKIRMKEAKIAADMAGFEIISADFDDLTVNSANEQQLKKLIRVIRYARPDVIIIHHPNDYCSDHVELSKLVFRLPLMHPVHIFCRIWVQQQKDFASC